MKILVVDDEKDIVNLVSYNLEKEGFKVLKAYDGETALQMVQTRNPDLVILDLMLPGVQGLEVCKAIRKNPRSASLPIIMLTAKGDEVDRVLGLEMGADDYVAKPFSVRELSARVRAILRRIESRKEPEKETFSFGNLHIDYESYDVSIDGKKINLSPTELKLLFFFSRHPGRVYTRDQILDHVWGDTAFVTPRTVDVHVRRLRAQIEKDLENPRYILTVRGVGYKFADSGL
jgi:two-component system alkaline phosphatase synthesis response regulator PhoP